MFTEPNNETRAEWAQAALDTFASQTNMDQAGEETDTIMGDLLANLMHLCHQQGLDFSQVLSQGRGHFEAELSEAKEELPNWAFLGATITAAPAKASVAGDKKPAVESATTTGSAKEIVVRVDAGYIPADGDAYDAVQSALEHFGIPSQISERTIAPVRIVIGSQGGVVQGATASAPVQFLLYDYDVQDAGADEVAVVPSLDGATVEVLKCVASIRDTEVDSKVVGVIFDAVAAMTAAE